MNAKPLAVGDVVWLRSGGPPMTVASAIESEAIECVWQAGEGFSRATFPSPCLTRDDPKEERVKG